MRYPIRISAPWRPLFSIFGFRRKSSFIDLYDRALTICFGTASETIPVADIASADRRKWPFYYGLGPKLGPAGGVSYVGSTNGVVEIRFVTPRPLNVWGPFRSKKAKQVVVSLEDPEGFLAALNDARQHTAS